MIGNSAGNPNKAGDDFDLYPRVPGRQEIDHGNQVQGRGHDEGPADPPGQEEEYRYGASGFNPPDADPNDDGPDDGPNDRPDDFIKCFIFRATKDSA